MIFSRTCMKEMPASCSKCLYSITSTPVPVCAATGCVLSLHDVDVDNARREDCPLVCVEDLIDRAMEELNLK